MSTMTWKEFKESVDKALAEAGKSDEVTIVYMDFSYPESGDFENENIKVFIQDDSMVIY